MRWVSPGGLKNRVATIAFPPISLTLVKGRRILAVAANDFCAAAIMCDRLRTITARLAPRWQQISLNLAPLSKAAE